MQFKNNITGDIITAYMITNVLQGADNYAVSFSDLGKTIGLYPSQTIDYIPERSDFYIDAGDIVNNNISENSQIMQQAMFLASYTQVN